MGLVKAKTEKRPESNSQRAANPVSTREELSAALADADSGVRRRAAKEIAGSPNAAAALVVQLKGEMDTSVREAIFNSLVLLKDRVAVSGLIDCLRSEDAALRNQAIEAMRQMGGEPASVLESLLSDPDPDVRVFAVNILGSNRHPDLEKWLIRVIDVDAHVNVCAAALDLLYEVGTEAAAESLTQLKARFVREPYIQFAADLALKRIRGA